MGVVSPLGSESGPDRGFSGGSIDASSGLWTSNLGNVRLGFPEELRRSLAASMMDPDYTRTTAARLARELLERTDYHSRAMFHTSGSAANEAAIAMVREHFRAKGLPLKAGIVSLAGGYHGSTELLSSIAVGNAPGFFQIPAPLKEAAADQALSSLRRLLEVHGETIACLIFEPVMSDAGVVVLEEDWIGSVIGICRNHQVKVIADEVATGLGRSGAWYATAKHRVDVITIGKGLGCGFVPITASLYSESLLEPLIGRTEDPLDIGSTMDGYAVGCAVGLKVLETIESEGLIDRANSVGKMLKVKLDVLSELPFIEAVSGRGLMLGIRLGGEQVDRSELLSKISTRLRAQKILLHPISAGLAIMPPLTISDEHAERLGDALVDVVSRAEG